MKVVKIGINGIVPAVPVKATHPVRGEYLRFEHGQEGRGRKLVFFPLGSKDFPAERGLPEPDQAYRLIPVSGNKTFILGRENRPSDEFLVLWSLSPGFRGDARYTVEGCATVIAEGYEAQGDAGRMGGAPCPVIHVTGPCVLKWTRGGRLYDSPANWRAVFDGKNWAVASDSPESDAVEAAFDY
jgi:hypothetical protein